MRRRTVAHASAATRPVAFAPESAYARPEHMRTFSNVYTGAFVK